MHEREGRPQEDFWMRFVADKPDTDLKQRAPEILGCYKSLADVISRKTTDEERAASPGKLARLASSWKAP